MADKGESRGSGRSGNKADRGGSGTLGSGSDFTSYGPAEGFRDGGRDDSGNKMGAIADTGRGGGFFGNITPGRIAGGLLGGLFGGPIGGLIGAGIGGGIGGGRGGWGYTDAQGNRVSAGRDMIDGGGPGRSGDTFQGGGLLSRVGNSLGIRPAGYRDRQEALAAQAAQAAAMGGTGVVGGRGGGGGIPPVGSTDLTGTSAGLGQTFPSLTAADIARLQTMGMGQNAMAGEPPTAQEMAALLRGPGMLPSPRMDLSAVPLASQRYLDQYGMPLPNQSARPAMAPPPNAFAPYGLENPAMDAVFQGTPGVSIGQSDLGTVRPTVSAGSQAIRRPPSAGAAPFADTQSYQPPGMAPAAMSQSPMAGQYAPVLSGFNVMPGMDFGAPARTPPSMYQPNPITSTRGAGTVPAASPALPPSPYGGQSFDPVAQRARIAAERARMEAEAANLGNRIRRVYNN